MMKITITILLSLMAVGCGIFQDEDDGGVSDAKIYVTLQGLDQVAVLSSSGPTLLKYVSTDFTENETPNTPHFITIDETNGYWFVSTIGSGYLGMYDLESDTLISTLLLGDSPALMAVDEANMKIYCSRMMPMGGMMTGSTSRMVQEVDYSSGVLLTARLYEVDSPAPHGIAIDPADGVLITASNTADWLYKIDLAGQTYTGVPLDPDAAAPANVEIQRLKPIQCAIPVPGRALVTCSAGIWMNPYTGEELYMPGLIQLWDTDSMSLLDTLQFDWHAKPWHSILSHDGGELYVSLSGDNQVNASAGVACATVTNDELELKWVMRDEIFSTLHGIDISADGARLYVTSRTTGLLYVLNAENGELITTVTLSESEDTVMAGGVAVVNP